MAKSTPYRSDCSARERLEQQLREENQRIKDICFQVTGIDPDLEPSRYEALVCAMLDALDRQVALDSAARHPQMAAQQVDLIDGIEVERGALTSSCSCAA